MQCFWSSCFNEDETKSKHVSDETSPVAGCTKRNKMTLCSKKRDLNWYEGIN